jgi:hypothetical protein
VKGTSDPVTIERHVDETNRMRPIDPHALVHFVAACQVAGVSVSGLTPSDHRCLIQRLSRLSIPDAVKLLRRKVHP